MLFPSSPPGSSKEYGPGLQGASGRLIDCPTVISQGLCRSLARCPWPLCPALTPSFSSLCLTTPCTLHSSTKPRTHLSPNVPSPSCFCSSICPCSSARTPSSSSSVRLTALWAGAFPLLRLSTSVSTKKSGPRCPQSVLPAPNFTSACLFHFPFFFQACLKLSSRKPFLINHMTALWALFCWHQVGLHQC